MAKEDSYDPERVARGLFQGKIPKKIGMTAFLEITGVLMNWVRNADRRAKRAEAKMVDQPNWRVRYNDVQRTADLLRLRLKNSEANLSALQKQYEDCGKMNDEIMTAYSKQETELNALLAQYKGIAEAAIMRANAFAEMSHVQERIREADVKLASLGVAWAHETNTKG